MLRSNFIFQEIFISEWTLSLSLSQAEQKAWSAPFNKIFVFYIPEKSKWSKLYVYWFKSVRQYLKRVAKIGPPPTMNRIKWSLKSI